MDPAVILQSAAEAFRPAAEENGLTLQLEIGSGLGTIQADAGRLQQIVTNLLSNALKFTPRGGTVTVRAERVGDAIVITVKDTGIGMDPEFVPFVFERFRQADSSTTRAHPGAGLGLAIARHLVQLHGGSIEAASGGPGCGATFTAASLFSSSHDGRSIIRLSSHSHSSAGKCCCAPDWPVAK